MKRAISFAVCLFVCQVICYAQPVVVKSSDKITAAISLHNASPSSIMLTTKIFNPKDFLMNQNYVWQREKQSASASFKPEIDLTGIDRIVADKDSILTVYGDKTAVERFTKEVLALDVVRKKVQLSVQVYSIEADKAKDIGLEGTLNASVDQPQTEATKIALLKDNAQLLNSPIITTFDYSVAEIFISEGPSSFTLRAIPYINGDETITLVLYAAVDRKEKGQVESTFTQMRVEDRHSFLVGGFVGGNDDKSNKLLLLVTPTAIK